MPSRLRLPVTSGVGPRPHNEVVAAHRAYSVWLVMASTLVTCLACTGPQSVETTPAPGDAPKYVGCQDGRQGELSRAPGRGALGVTLGGTDGPAPDPLPRADDVGVKTDQFDTILFWKAPMVISTPADIVVTIEPPHYLAYVPSSVWTSSPSGVDVDPWRTRELHVSPCDDGAGQVYLGGLLLDPAQSCVTIEIESELNGRSQRSELRLDAASTGC